MKTNFFGIFKKRPRVRMAPSPTGYLHIGTARTALFNYLFAKHHKGTFVLRIEDTDKERSTKEYEMEQIEGLTWLGLSFDEFYRQSERTDVYRTALHTLIGSGRAYVSNEESKKEPGKTVEVVRLRNPGRAVTFTDEIRGDITFDTTELEDFVIARSIDDPLYHLTVVVDDAAMCITDVIRGEDHISNTQRQILIQEALGYERPRYAHLPLILAPDRSKMSKRQGATTVRQYREEGIIPEAFNNFLAFLGWNPGDEREVMTMDELISAFDLSRIQQSGGVFDHEKLMWFNREHLKRLSREAFRERLAAFAPHAERRAENFLPLLQERAGTLKEAADLVDAPEFSFMHGIPAYDPVRLIPSIPNLSITREDVKAHLSHIVNVLKSLPDEDLTTERVRNALWEYATEKGRGAVLWPMRFALSGVERSPDPFTIVCLVGKEEALSRLVSALRALDL